MENLAKLLEENFIYPKIGKSYANMLLSKMTSGAYSKFGSAEEFAKVVTADLQSIHPEGHLKLFPPSTPTSVNSAAENVNPIRGIGKAGWLAPRVAYMSIHGFTGAPEEITRLRKILNDFSTAKILIIDGRFYDGGGLRETDLMFSYFFDKPTTIIQMDTRLDVEQRGGSFLIESETLKRIAAPEGIVRREQVAIPSEKKTNLMKAQIFLLTSKKTASGGEHFSLAMKRTGRATLIGEKTAGAGHFGRTRDLGGGYRAFIPIGRPFDPDTGKGWEQTGVEPHIKVPAEKALDEALRRARVNPSAARNALKSFKIDQSPH
ncbi:MAG: S41 family peptidase [Acidobacteria bacterium]|nr:S41 family peptidase [Acidobacteriota bacterium]MCA1637004.1 S41 family peptidase [Acidobacteriota bacterium]